MTTTINPRYIRFGAAGGEAVYVRPARVLCCAVAALIIGALVPVAPLRVALVTPTALLAPGYAITVALFGPHRPLDPLPALALNLLLSMAFYPLLALLLNAAALRLSTTSVSAGAVLFIALCAALCLARGRATALVSEGDYTPVGVSGVADITGVSGPSTWEGVRGALLLSALVAASGALVVGAMRLQPGPAPMRDTEFYLAGRWARLGVVARPLPGHALSVQLGITNDTGRRQTYWLSPLLDDTRRWGDRVAVVPAGHTWSGTVSGAAPRGGCAHRLSVTLRVKGQRRALSILTMWVSGEQRLPMSCMRGRPR